MDNEELIEFLSEMDEALREAIRFTKRGCPSRLIIEKLEGAQNELLDRLSTVAEYELAHREMREQLQKVVSEKVNLVNQIKRMEEGNITVVPDGLRIR